MLMAAPKWAMGKWVLINWMKMSLSIGLQHIVIAIVSPTTSLVRTLHQRLPVARMKVVRMSSQVFPYLQNRKLERYLGGGHSWCRAFMFASTLSLTSGFTTECSYYPHSRWESHRGDLRRLKGAKYCPPRVTNKRFASHERSNGEEKDEPSFPSDNEPIRSKDPREYILSKSTIQPEDRIILEATLDWIENVVISMNLCPFAEKPFKNQQMYLEVVEGRDENEILIRVLRACITRKSKPGTSLVICPDLYPKDFQTFLQVYNMMNDGVLVENDLTDDVQIAPFHPLFEFDGSGKDGLDNYTNRSPYPIFHVLREEEVGRAVDLLDGDASKVWRRNVELLEALGEELELQQLKQVMTGKQTDGAIQEKVKAILRDLKKRTKEI